MSISLVRRLSLAWLAAGMCPLAMAQSSANQADTEVRALLMHSFDRPEERLKIEALMVVGEHALASWAQGTRGGRALLRRRHGHWAIVACGGDGLIDPAALADADIPRDERQRLLAGMKAQEARLSAAQRQLFGSFGATQAAGALSGH